MPQGGSREQWSRFARGLRSASSLIDGAALPVKARPPGRFCLV
jgi:hypothetical protein